MPGKRVQLDDETWQALDLLARDRMQSFQELADEAFRDLLRKHGRPTDLKSALRQSLGESATIHKLPVKKAQEATGERVAFLATNALRKSACKRLACPYAVSQDR